MTVVVDFLLYAALGVLSARAGILLAELWLGRGR